MLFFCPLAAIPMRHEPSDRSEMVNQMILGEVCSVLDENEKWFMVRLQHDGYEGWVDKKQLAPLVELPSTHMVKSSFLILENGLVAPCGAYITEQQEVDADLLSLAADFKSTPYLWGGRTFMGIDCSGYMQVIFRAVGKSLPRDAYQQAELGETVSFINEAQAGDLAFFDNSEGRITHVGLIEGSDDKGIFHIWHASGEVRRDVIDHQGIFNTTKGQYSHNLRLIKRL